MYNYFKKLKAEKEELRKMIIDLNHADCFIKITKKGINLDRSIKGNALLTLLLLNNTIKEIQKEIDMSDEEFEYFLKICNSEEVEVENV